ncbi:Malate dehydrogenase (oxaloacetate-decarboxylating) [Pediococcus acidilactici]|uniref:NAD(P)-dependent malic enzyme n=1 Tax=Pediococcus acidilactici TaxID=1254 RepID=UPI0007F006A3|nr:NADP-dependent malic enzyme [Pediococcus acidilactici]ARW24488.1 Malate dehydrogenase (oxaloacetate-decarboxylating) [Pediococcus acidilactici]ARW26527.1 Malate dehydrogenase (oxaloacetate-decarboxylating) [Pediococcus acidilactici]ARW28606.1 Malate dehydrogenase (oxaloacetate-decarboxylating) [Pediococcus acidilactici]OBR30803.1 Malate dehydrogenase (oxaloacetate-decarboxylating) [Pediococcus acidilactici]WDA27106.1 NADP-dependent malic enzyme [Pediococcus acidilactici]
MDKQEIIELHKKQTGVLEVTAELPVRNSNELGKAYTPGVAELSRIIYDDPKQKDELTISGKLVAVVTDGSAVLGLGDIGPSAGLPVVEGKALLYKELSGVNAIPLALSQSSVPEFVKTVKNISKSFAGIHLEDIKAPRCFEIEEQLSQQLDIPVYHDDQEGTAIVVLAGLINAAKVVNKELTDLKIVINGAGASGLATAKLLATAGLKHVTLVDQKGVIRDKRTSLNQYQLDVAKHFEEVKQGTDLADALVNQDVFIGLSVGDIVNKQMIKSMVDKPIIFALANPRPEVDPKVAREAGAAVIATGSSTYPNQVNNILVFPGLFKGLLEEKIKHFKPQMEMQIAEALANIISNPTAENIVPGVFDKAVVETVVTAVKNSK